MKTEKKSIPFAVGQLLHGGDYNPDQWLDRPEILTEDIRLMLDAHINCVSLGIFAWAALEPEEGKYELDWLKEMIDRLYNNGIYTILATPTGAIPPWMSAGYEEVLQTDSCGFRNYPGNRHNFCPSSPVMREKMHGINSKLAQRLGSHPGVIAWHISNEYGGNGREATCHCEYCQESFRRWLKEKYKTLDALNAAWWTSFWSHTYTDWSQIHSPSPRGENVLHGLKLDWKRYVSAQLQDFCRDEIHTVRQYSDLPATTNFMGFYKPLDYFKWAQELDVISWDCYPDWHSGSDEIPEAVHAAAAHSLMRSLKKTPFLMMESTPSLINWRPVNRLKRPGMHALSSLQAVAHGSDSVLYFQWRKSRGSCEKFHGAVLDHKNGSDTRVFEDVSEIGRRLQNISDRVRGTCPRTEVALIFDWENWWAMEDACAVENGMDYQELFLSCYRTLWEMGIAADIVDMDGELDGYGVVIAPFNYMYRGDYAQRVRGYVKEGGCYVTTCWSGEVDDTDLCFMGEHPLRDVLGIRTEEIDAPGGYCQNNVIFEGVSYEITGLCGLIHAEGAQVLAEYQKDFYAGRPALTKNRFGKGDAWYMASWNEPAFLRALFNRILEENGIGCGFHAELPVGVTVAGREDDHGGSIWFLQNFNRTNRMVMLNSKYRNVETGDLLEGETEMPAYSCLILEKAEP